MNLARIIVGFVAATLLFPIVTLVLALMSGHETFTAWEFGLVFTLTAAMTLALAVPAFSILWLARGPITLAACVVAGGVMGSIGGFLFWGREPLQAAAFLAAVGIVSGAVFWIIAVRGNSLVLGRRSA